MDEASLAALATAGTPASRRLADIMAQLERHRRHQEQHSPLGTADLRLLWLFSDGTPRTLRVIADDLGLEQSTVNRQVNAALSAGILRRYRETGASAHLVEATPRGVAAFEQGVQEILRSYDAVLSQMTEADRERLLELLDTFVGMYTRADRVTTEP
ncbi:MarR family winged helix-turn-helix transcriptional regulator [Nocardia sp. alder85J]|uniref:MarR family winged helix-turn-helix transcriptional regulator n=1 Tax=Nocardia sp. alder85J TaxID=2862949 RepID=UPI001CD6CEEC|nr:MarR family winged helix-turn-helix transcriptional regulator [Nocardia sp. alder85J]MCX4092309.1 MarR family winged helix-turn-helix transcriptional regulator [Nocardia sp. alder85J]